MYAEFVEELCAYVSISALMYVFMFAYFFILLYFFVLWATAANTDVYINSKYISRRAKGMASRLRYPPLNYATK